MIQQNSRYVASAIITLHREGILAHTTLLSIGRARAYAESNGLRTELVIVLDKADAETKRAALAHPVLRATDQLHEVDYGDLSLSRNHGIKCSRGEYIGTFDGDDYFSENWIERAIRSIEWYGAETIAHPELIVAFGAWQAYWWQIDQPGEHYRPEALLMLNYWNACAFARREVFERYPYAPSKVGENGFGYEDWHWNCDTIAAGYVHRLAWKTVRFERRKANGSLNLAHQSVSAVIRPSPFFGNLKNFLRESV